MPIQALDLIQNPKKDEIKILNNFKYKKNLALIHQMKAVMPKNKKNGAHGMPQLIIII